MYLRRKEQSELSIDHQNQHWSENQNGSIKLNVKLNTMAVTRKKIKCEKHPFNSLRKFKQLNITIQTSTHKGIIIETYPSKCNEIACVMWTQTGKIPISTTTVTLNFAFINKNVVSYSSLYQSPDSSTKINIWTFLETKNPIFKA